MKSDLLDMAYINGLPQPAQHRRAGGRRMKPTKENGLTKKKAVPAKRASKKPAPVKTRAAPVVITAYKGFDADWNGWWGAASATGESGAASATGWRGAAMACGRSGRAMGADGCALFLAERDGDWNIVSVWAGVVGRDGIKPMVWYALENGQPREVRP